MKHVLTVLALLLVCLAAHAAPMMLVSPADIVPPVLDGLVYGEAVWQVNGLRSGFSLLGAATGASQKTMVGVLYDHVYLYVGFVCQEDRMGEMVARERRRDADLSAEDTVTLLLAPEPGSARYYQFTVNALGCVRDARMLDESFNTRAGAIAHWEPGLWSVELAIPLADLGLTVRAGDTWSANFGRVEQPHGERSSWAPCRSRFTEPSSFGLLRVVGGPNQRCPRWPGPEQDWSVLDFPIRMP